MSKIKMRQNTEWVPPPTYDDIYTETVAIHDKNSRRAKMELDKKRKRHRDDEDYDT